MNARSNRSFLRTMGFVLVLFLVLAVSPLTAGAAGNPVAITPPSEGSSLTVDAQGRVVIPIRIEPLTSFSSTGTVQLVIRFRRAGSVVSEAVYSPMPSFVYADLPTVANVAYKLPSGFGPNGVKFGSASAPSFVGTTVYLTVYVDEVAQEGGGGGGGTTIGDTTGTNTGWQTYSSESDSATLYVDPEKTGSLYQSAPASGLTLVKAPTVGTDGHVPGSVTASLPLAVVNQGGGASVPSVLDMGSLQMTLSPAVMQSLGRNVGAAAGTIASLKIKVQSATQTETQGTLTATGENLAGLNAASRVITVSFVAVDAQGRETTLTVDRASLSISFNPEAVKDPSKVNLYIIGSLIYIGGKVDPSKHTVSGNVAGIKDARVVALEYNKTFADVSGHWAKSDIELMASKYVVKGVSENEYQPERSVTRAEMLALLVRSLGLDEYKPGKATFSDVAPGAWYYGCVEAGRKAGLTFGDKGDGGAFRPQDTVSREEMAAFLVRALKLGGKEPKLVVAGEILARFGDASKVSGWAASELAQAVNEGLMRGRPGGQFDPLGTGSRAEAATVMSRFMKEIGKI